MASRFPQDQKPTSRSVYMSSDGDGDVEVDEQEDTVSDSFGNVSIVELCQPCKQTNKKTEAKWNCGDCNKHICDDCKIKHDMFTKGHTLTRIMFEMCMPCLDDNKTTTEATRYCPECDKCMCNTCNSYHGRFFKNHNVSPVHIDGDGKKAKKPAADANLERKSSPAQFRSKILEPYIDPVDVSRISKVDRTKPVTTVEQLDKTEKQPSVKLSEARSQLPTVRKETRTFSERRLKLLCKKRVAVSGEKTELCIQGSAYLSDGRLLLVDMTNKSLKLFDADLHFIDQMKYSRLPWDVAAYYTNEIAVSFSSAKQIVRVCVDGDMKLKEICSLSTSHECCGITYITKEQLAVVTGGERALVILTIDGKELQRISTDTRDRQLFKHPWYVAVDVERSCVYVSDFGNCSVTAINLTSHEVVYVYKHEQLSSLYRLALDKDGYVYACGFLSRNIHRIKPDGVNAGIFPVTGYGPKTISFNPNTNETIIGGSSENVSLYSIV